MLQKHPFSPPLPSLPPTLLTTLYLLRHALPPSPPCSPTGRYDCSKLALDCFSGYRRGGGTFWGKRCRIDRFFREGRIGGMLVALYLFICFIYNLFLSLVVALLAARSFALLSSR